MNDIKGNVKFKINLILISNLINLFDVSDECRNSAGSNSLWTYNLNITAKSPASSSKYQLLFSPPLSSLFTYNKQLNASIKKNSSIADTFYGTQQ